MRVNGSSQIILFGDSESALALALALYNNTTQIAKQQFASLAALNAAWGGVLGPQVLFINTVVTSWTAFFQHATSQTRIYGLNTPTNATVSGAAASPAATLSLQPPILFAPANAHSMATLQAAVVASALPSFDSLRVTLNAQIATPWSTPEQVAAYDAIVPYL